jgi:hypothetical protein
MIEKKKPERQKVVKTQFRFHTEFGIVRATAELSIDAKTTAKKIGGKTIVPVTIKVKLASLELKNGIIMADVIKGLIDGQ